MPLLILALLACRPVDLYDYPAPDAWDPPEGPGGPATSFTEDQLWQHCAYLPGGEGDIDHHNLVVMHDGYLLMPWAPEDGGGGITFWDFEDPCDPQVAGEGWSAVMRESHTMATGIVDDREYLAVAYHQDGATGGIGFWDITDRAAPVWVSEMTVPDYDYPDAYFRVVLSTFWQGDVLYVGTGLSGIFAVDVSDPFSPSILAQHTRVANLVGTFHAIGNLGLSSSAGLAYTVLYDVSDPLALESIPGGEWNVEDADGDLQNYYFAGTGGKYALFARNDEGGGPILYDISDPSEPTFVGQSLNTDGDGGYVFRQNDLLYQGESNFGAVYDMSDPTAPYEISRLDLTGDLDTVTPIGNVAVVSVDDDAIPGQSTAVIPAYLDPDAIPPTVELSSPADGEVWVPTSGRIGVSFDEMVEIYSVFEGSFRVWDERGQPVPGRFNTQENIVNFTPDALLTEDTTYHVEIPAGGIVDFSGNPTASDWRFSFSTGEVVEEIKW